MHFMYQQFTEMRNDYPPLLVALTKFRRQTTEQINLFPFLNGNSLCSILMQLPF